MRDKIEAIIEDEINDTDWFPDGEERSQDMLYYIVIESKAFLALFDEDEDCILYDPAHNLVKEIIKEDWVEKAIDDAKRGQWESDQEARDPYGWRGLHRSDFV